MSDNGKTAHVSMQMPSVWASKPCMAADKRHPVEGELKMLLPHDCSADRYRWQSSADSPPCLKAVCFNLVNGICIALCMPSKVVAEGRVDNAVEQVVKVELKAML